MFCGQGLGNHYMIVLHRATCSIVMLFHGYLLHDVVTHLVNLLEMFSVMESYGEIQLEKGLEKCKCSELALGQILEDGCPLPHLGSISLNLQCFLVLTQMFYIWRKLTRQAIRQ